MDKEEDSKGVSITCRVLNVIGHHNSNNLEIMVDSNGHSIKKLIVPRAYAPVYEGGDKIRAYISLTDWGHTNNGNNGMLHEEERPYRIQKLRGWFSERVVSDHYFW